MTPLTHFGIYFTAQHVEDARQHRKRAPFDAAYTWLNTAQSDDPIADAIIDGFRWRFNADEQAAGRGVAFIERGVGFDASGLDYVGQCMHWMALGHAFEMLRDGTTLSDEMRRGWLRVYGQHVDALLGRMPSEALGPLDAIWRAALELVASVVLERGDMRVLGVEDFRRLVAEMVHPEGYIPAIVERGDGAALSEQVLAAKGLVLGAEAATHAGYKLWDYEMRGISARTPAIYAAAYYEYRESWRWDTPPNEADNAALYHQHGAFLELLNRQLRPEVLHATMGKLRPMFDAYGGGLTTLSHGVVRRRGWFGR